MLGWNESAWFAMLSSAALKSTVVLGVAWLLAWALRRRSAAARHLVWTAAAAALLALPVLSVTLPALRVRTHAFATLAPTITFSTLAVAKDGASLPAAPQASGTPQPQKSASWNPDFRLWTMLLWAAGSALGLAYMLAACVVMGRTRRNTRPVSDAELFRAILQFLGISQNVELRELPRGAMPMSFGVRRPVVFLPADAHQWSDDRRRMVLLHELAHVKRGDIAARFLVRTAVCLFWWNPLAWTAWRALLQESERAADDLVLTTGERASEYAGHLLEIARGMQHSPAAAWAAVAMARPSQLEGRLLAILDARTDRQSPGRRAALAAAGLALILVAPFAALEAQDKVAPAPPPPPPPVAAAIRAANQPKNSETLDSAAAQQLPENPVAQRAETSDEHSSDSATSLMKLGDLAVSRRQYGEAGSYYLRAVDLGDTPETAPALVYLAGQALGKQHLEAAAEFVDRALAVAPTGPLAGRALTYKGNIALANQLPGLAESNYVQALTQDPKGSAEAAFTMETYARLLMEQSRTTEAHTMQQDAKAIRAARVAAISPRWTGEPAAPAQPASPTSRATTVETTPTGSGDSASRADKAVVLAQTPVVEIARAADAALAGNDGTYRIGGGVSAPMETGGVYRVGGGVSAPVLLSKVEPAYSPEALAAQFQGTVVLSVVIRPDGRVYNIQVVRSLGLGLDEQAAEAVTQWKFEPGKRGGAPVAVGATIEVNFRML